MNHVCALIFSQVEAKARQAVDLQAQVSKAAASASALYEKVTNPESPLMKMGTSAVQLLDDTAVKVGQPRNVVAAAVIGAAVAAGAAIAGLFSKSRK